MLLPDVAELLAELVRLHPSSTHYEQEGRARRMESLANRAVRWLPILVGRIVDLEAELLRNRLDKTDHFPRLATTVPAATFADSSSPTSIFVDGDE